MIGKGSSCEHLVLASVSARAAELPVDSMQRQRPDLDREEETQEIRIKIGDEEI